MPDLLNKNAVAAIRVSTTKQGTEGDSPEAQKEQIERFAAAGALPLRSFSSSWNRPVRNNNRCRKLSTTARTPKTAYSCSL